MTPGELAALHARCFTVPRPFSQAEFAEFRADPACFFIIEPAGFAIGRSADEEAELLTIAVDPDRRRQGVGQELLAKFESDALRRSARRVFLEVAASNAAACSLYGKAGYARIGVRRGYYLQEDGTREDAILMEKRLELRETSFP